MKFLYFKTKNIIKDKISTILEIISEAIDIIKYHNDLNSLTIFYTYSSVSIDELANIMVSELYEDISIYESLTYKDEKKLEEALKIVKDIFNETYVKDNYVNNKILLMVLRNKADERIKKLVLNNYYNDQDMRYTIKTFLEDNQNVTIAAESLYLHRNTLNQRLTKFEEATSFNVKKFIDGYLIYNIIK